jgi:hypothetical protein
MLKSKLMTGLAVLAIATFCFGSAFAEETAPTAKPVEKKVEDRSAPKVETTEAATKTTTPMESMMKWVGSQVKASAGDDCKCCGEAWKKWFSGGADVPMSGMRDQLVADGWTAESTIAFFKQMRKAKSGESSGCGDCAKSKDCSDCKDCADCKDCGDCDGGCPCDKAKGDCGGDCPCDKAKGDCGGGCPCDKQKAPKKDAAP